MLPVKTRADEDILDDIHDLLTTYPPLQHDRHAIQIRVERGVVTVTGHIKAMPTYEYLAFNLPKVKGILHVNADDLYEDETIRREVGKVTPLGTQVRVEYGVVILTGQLPSDMSVEDVVNAVAEVRGVARIITAFG
ncbi:MAG: BON domain-containing protein [Anaerolineae bacterium]|nr:BON domain-containing protein [Anaerolineae bacterium]